MDKVPKIPDADVKVPEERFQVRESMFTTAIRTSATARVAYSTAIAVVAVILMTNCAKYICLPNVFRKDVEFVYRSFSDLHIVIAYEIIMTAGLISILLPSVKIRNHSLTSAIAGISAATIFVIAFPIFVRFCFDLHEVMAIVVIFEQVRFVMKMISFIAENMKNENEDPSISSFLYFLYAPTLIYRSKYPLKANRDWNQIAIWSMEILAVMWLGLIVLNRGFLETFNRIGRKDLTMEDHFDLLRESCSMAFLSHIAIAYTFLHCWLNLWGELLLFGDRMFYKNWLNSKGPLHMLTLWNFLIHSWIKEYLYRPVVKRTKNKPMALLLSFLISWLFHDYCVALPLKINFFVYTMSIVQCTMLAPVALVWQRFAKDNEEKDTSDQQGLNTTFFLSLTLGNILMVAIISIRYFEYVNCPNVAQSFEKSFSPFIITGKC